MRWAIACLTIVHFGLAPVGGKKFAAKKKYAGYTAWEVMELIAQWETRGNQRAVGGKGEVSRYQILDITRVHYNWQHGSDYTMKQIRGDVLLSYRIALWRFEKAWDYCEHPNPHYRLAMALSSYNKGERRTIRDGCIWPYIFGVLGG